MQVSTIKFLVVGVLLVLLCVPSRAQAKEPFLVLAVPLAQKSQRDTAVPASVTLAQAMWETGSGEHPIGDANNYFGIKAGASSDGSVNFGSVAVGWVWADTKEWNGTKYVERRERFRRYRSIEDSFLDHGLLLATTPRYASAMLAVDDPREFARRIAAAGYATSPTYARDLIAVMDKENLYQYDLPRNALVVVSQSDDLSVNAGDIFQIYFEVKNTGFGTWSPTADYYLESSGDERFGALPRQELDQLVQPNRAKRWALTMFAPAQVGTYTTSWQLKHGAQNIGESMRVEVQVRPTSPPQVLYWLGGFSVMGGAGLVGVSWFAHRRRTRKTPRSHESRGYRSHKQAR